MNIAVIGTGYVGVVSGVCLAAKGHHVVCVDLRADVVEQLNRAHPHIHETGLPELLRTVTTEKRFRATTSLADALETAELVLISVGTPSTDGKIDLQYIRQASEQVGRLIKPSSRFLSIVIKSTVVPGTTDTFVRRVVEQSSGKQLGDFGLGMNPEFLREGNAIEDFMNPDRIVLGHEDPRTLELLRKAYAPWNCDKLEVNTRTAEMIKYANNSLLATQISAVNELANLCFELGNIDVQQVMQGVHLDKRWSPIQPGGQRISPQILTYLIPGCGFGGSCFPKDVQALRTLGREHQLPMPLLQAVLDINDAQPLQVARLLQSQLNDLAGRKILVLGLAFKPETDDVRESASLRILRRLTELKCKLTAHDPIAGENARKALPDVPFELVSDWQARLDDADAVIVATRWNDYRTLATPDVAARLKGKILIDARRMFRPEDFPGATYLTIGRRISN